MKRARALLEQRLRARARPGLDLALLTDAGGRYAAARTVPIFVRALLRAGVHVIEVAFLVRQFPLEFLAPLFALRTLPGLLSGLHWGALEALRDRVRAETARRQRGGARATTEAYLLLAGAAGALLLTATAALVARQEDPVSGPWGLYGLFANVTAAAVAIELWTRTYHAGVFALGRVYRPALSLYAPDVFELAGVVLLFGTLGPFALHAVVLFGALLRGGIAVAYARRAYRARAMPLPRPARVRSLARLSWRDAAAGLGHAAATLPRELDRLLLLALLHAPPPAPPALALALPFYALRPVAGFAQSWALGFYTDFVRLRAAGFGVLRARFERLLARAAVVAGLLSACTFAAAAYALFGLRGLAASAWFLPLSLLRARFSLEQISRFAYGSYRELGVQGAVLLCGLLLAGRLELHDRALLVLVTGTLLASLVASRRLRARSARGNPRTRLPLSAWLHAVSTRAAPVCLSIARVDSRVASMHAVRATVAGQLGERGQVARVGRSWLLWWEPRELARARGDWARSAGGALAELHSVGADSGAQALQSALARALLPVELARALSAASAVQPAAALLQTAAELAPEAEPIDLRGAGRSLSRLPPDQLALVRHAVLAGAREQHHVPRRAALQVAVYAPAGEPEIVFVWPRGAAGGSRLHEAVRLASWRASIAAPARSR